MINELNLIGVPAAADRSKVLLMMSLYYIYVKYIIHANDIRLFQIKVT